MKIIAFGDAHLDAKVGGYDLHTDAARALEHVGTACVEQAADLRVMLGDMFHGNSPSPKAWATFNRTLFESPILIIVVPGNHDHAAYDPVREISMPPYSPSGISWNDAEGDITNGVCCPKWPCIVDVGEQIKVLVVPYVHNPAAMEEFGRTAQEMVDMAFVDALKHGNEVKAAFCHLDVDGAKAGTEGAYLRGGKLQMPMDLAKRCPFPILNGHIHRKQKMGNVYIPGSLVATDFGDADGPTKGYAVVEV